MASRRTMTTIAAICAVLGVMVFSTPAAAQLGDFGQFLVGKMSYYAPDVGNPTGQDMFALLIVYEADGDLDTAWGDGGCQGAIIPAHGTDDDEFDSSPTDYRTGFELIAVPTDSGTFDRTGNSKIGVYAQARKNRPASALKPSYFKTPPRPDRNDLVSCACSELSDWGLSSDLLRGAGIRCGLADLDVEGDDSVEQRLAAVADEDAVTGAEGSTP